MIDLEIATYWNVETLYYVFNGVASIMAGAGFSGLLKMVFLMALTIGIFAYAGNRQLELATWFIQALIFTTLLNLPIARVAITDKTALEPPRVVDNVPVALAVVAQTTNLAFGWLTETYETVFGVPEELGLQRGDLAFGHRILKNTNKVMIRDPQLRSDLMQFIKECTLYDIRDGAITPDQVVGQTGTWDTIFENTSPARFVTYNTLSPTPITDTCLAVGSRLKLAVDLAVGSAQTFYGKQAFSRAGVDALAGSLYASAIGSSYDWILSTSASASDAMRQAMFNNIWRDAGAELPALMSDTSRIQELQSLAGAAQAARQADGSNATLSKLAQETLPHMRNWLEAIIYAMFPIVVVMMVVVSQEGAKKIAGGYMMSLAWIGMWPVLFAVINHLSLLHLRHKMAALSLATTGGVPFQLSDVFDATLGDEQAAIGYMVVLVPFISGAIIKMGQGGFMSVADRMMSGFSSAGASAGSSLAAGNVSMGRVGLDMATVNTTSMNKYDSNLGLAGGGSTIGFGNGDIGTLAPNGAAALQQYRNQLLTSTNVESQVQSGRDQAGLNTYGAAELRGAGNRHVEGAGLVDESGKSNLRGEHQGIDRAAAEGRSGSEQGHYGSGESIDHRYSEAGAFNAYKASVESGRLGVSLRGGGGDSDLGADGRPNEGRPPSGGEVPGSRGTRPASGGEVPGSGAARAPSGTRGAATKGTGSLAKGAGSLLPVDLGASTQQNYGATHSKSRQDEVQHSIREDANVGTSYAITGDSTVRQNKGEQSSQTNHDNLSASRNIADEQSTDRGVTGRDEQSLANRVNRSQSDSFSIRRNLMEDPSFLEKVALRNGMNEVRFMGQGEGRRFAMIKDYLAEKGVASAASTMPTTNLDGSVAPTTKRDIDTKYERGESNLPNMDLDKKHQQNVHRTGYEGTEPVPADVTAPSIIGTAQAKVENALNPESKDSIPARAAVLDQVAATAASRDREIGAGRVHTGQVAEDAAARDVRNTLENTWKFLKGDGGSTLADNTVSPEVREKLENGVPITVNRPGQQ